MRRTADRSPELETPLVERERELAALTSLVAGAAGGDGGAVIVDGPAGIGKTRLLQSAVATAQAADVRPLLARRASSNEGFPSASSANCSNLRCSRRRPPSVTGSWPVRRGTRRRFSTSARRWTSTGTRRSTASTGSSRTWRPSGRCCSLSTTPSRPTSLLAVRRVPVPAPRPAPGRGRRHSPCRRARRQPGAARRARRRTGRSPAPAGAAERRWGRDAPGRCARRASGRSVRRGLPSANRRQSLPSHRTDP